MIPCTSRYSASYLIFFGKLLRGMNDVIEKDDLLDELMMKSFLLF